MKKPLFLSVLLAGAMIPSVCPAAEVESPQVAMKPTKISLFKNGFGFLSFEGKLPKSERVELENLPVPSFGSFWMGVSSPSKIVKLASLPVKTRVKTESGDFYETARANIGKEVKIFFSGGDEMDSDQGMILSISSAPEKRNPNLIGSTGGLDENFRKMIVLSKKSSPEEFVYSYIPVDEIREMIFIGGGKPEPAERDVEKTALELSLENPGEGSLHASCLAKGISWLPEYRMDLGDSGKALFQAQALVMNDLMDIDHAEVNFVSGFPALKFANIASPLAGTYENVGEFLGILNGGGEGASSNGLTRRVLRLSENKVAIPASYAADSFAGGAGAETPPNEVVKAGDLFFYPVKDFSCKYRETALVPLFDAEVSFKHLYVWDIPEQNQLQEWDRRFDAGSPASDDTSRDIWHCIRFANPFELPLTAGALEFMAKGNIVGQGFMDFISPGQEATVRINKTMQVTTTREEKTISSEQKKVQQSAGLDRIYTVSTIEGSLTMKNYSDKPMNMEITKRIQGTPVSASEKGSFSFIPGWNPMNPNGKFKWTVELPPGESKTLTYQYTYMGN